MLLVLSALEVLPFTVQDPPLMPGCEPGGFACAFEPIQVCDQGNPCLGTVAGLPFLVARTPELVLAPGIVALVPEGAAFAPDGFTPPIDHPPQLPV